MINLLICLLSLLLIAFYLCNIFNTTFGRVIPFSYVVVVIIQYISAVFGKLSYFKYLLIVLFTMMLLHLFLLSKLKGRKIYIKKHINLSFIIFVIFFVYNYINLSNVYYSNIDDLGYWGTRLDDMFRNDALYTTDSYVVFGGKGYPPFTHLLEFGICKLLGGLSDGNAIFALSTFTFSLFMPMFDKYKLNDKKDIVKSIILFIGVLLLMLCISLNPTNNNPSYIFNSIYVDWLLSIALMYGFYFIYIFDYNNIVDYLSISLSMFILIFTKQIGLALALLLFVTILVKHLIDKKYSCVTKLFIFALIPVLIYVSYNYYASFILNGNNVVEDISYVPVDSTFVSNGLFSEEGLKQIFDFFVFALKEPIMVSPLRLSYFVIVIVVFCILILLGKKNHEEKSYYAIPIFYFLGSIGYALGIELSYISLFSDGYSYPLFGRYMQTYTYFGFVLVFILFYSRIKNTKYLSMTLLISLLFVNYSSVNTLIYSNNREIYRQKERAEINNWVQVEYNYQKTLVVNQTDMRYLSLFKKTFGEKGENVTYKQFTKEDDLNSFKKTLNEYEYIIIGDSDSIFNELWSKVTDLPPYNSTLYKINNDGELSLEIVYIWEE